MLYSFSITGQANHHASWPRPRVIGFVLLCLLAACETVPLTPPGESENPTEQPPTEEPQPGSPSIAVTPTEVTLEGIGNTILLQATAITSTGQSDQNPSLTWASNDESVASVTSGGLVTAVGEGTTLVIVTYQAMADTATVHVQDEGLPPPPPPSGEWDQELSNVTIEGDVVVPDGEAWLIGPNVEIAGNLRTEGGTIGMRPGSYLKFLGANPDEYVGGGLTYSSEFARDIGLWVSGDGVLDIRGTPKEAWNRTGTHETWGPDDELWIAPTDPDDFTPRRWFPGDPIPQIDPRVPAAEVINVTRDIVIEGPGHIHIHSTQPQVIEYVQLRGLGVSNVVSEGPVLGRYALHLHVNEDGSRGTVIRGVAAIDSKGRVFVPHASHGVTLIDNVSVNSYAEALWWDLRDYTNDLLVDRLAASGVEMPRELLRKGRRFNVTTLGSGINKEIKNSAVSGGRRGAVGFDWPSQTSSRDPHWIFLEGNVAHNNAGMGLRFWTNGSKGHVTEGAITYRNGKDHQGLLAGAYANDLRFANMLIVDDNIVRKADNKPNRTDRGPPRFTNVQVFSDREPALVVGTRGGKNLDDTYIEFINCTFESPPGQPKVYIGRGSVPTSPWKAHFIRSGVVPDDIVFDLTTDVDGDGVSENGGSHVLIDHEDGRKWEILIENGQKIVRER